MTQSTLYVLRGLPGSGKSTWGRNKYPHLTPYGLAPPNFDGPVTVSADHYFTDLHGEYHFDVTKLSQAFTAAQCNLVTALRRDCEVVIVDNTHCQLWEMSLALELGRAFFYKVEVVDLFDGGCTDEELFERNTHGVPLEVITAMRGRWET